MSKITLEIDEALAESLRLPPDERTNRLRQELAVRLYQKELLTFGKARALAGLDKWAFHALLASERIERHYDAEELEEDLKTLGS